MAYDAYLDSEEEQFVIDTEFCQRVQDILLTIGVKSTVAETGHVIATTEAAGKAYGEFHILSAKEFFFPHTQTESTYRVRDPRERKFSTRMYECLENAPRAVRDVTVVLVGEESLLGRGEFTILRWMFERDDRQANKYIVSFEGLAELIKGPFAPLDKRAALEPMVYVTPEYYVQDKPDYEAIVTSHFNQREFHLMLEDLQARPNAAAIKEQANALFHRIMGIDYYLKGSDTDWPLVGRDAGTDGMPYDWASGGEKVAVAFCLFLALEYDNVYEGQCIGVRSALNTLDLSIQAKVLDCLTTLVINTGISVYLQTDNSANRTFSERRLKVAQDVAIHAARNFS